MVVTTDFRDLLVELTARSSRAWGLPETIVSREALAEAVRLGDEATFLDVAGYGSPKEKDGLLGLLSWLDSEQGHERLMLEGERWEVRGIVAVAAEALVRVKQSLEDDWSPAMVGVVLRALPVMAASRFSPLGDRLAHMLGVEANPGTLIETYADAFCRRDREALSAVDAVIIDDRVLGTLAMEMASRLLHQLGGKAKWLDESVTGRLVDCLTLLIDDMIKKSAVKCGGNQRDEEATP